MIGTRSTFARRLIQWYHAHRRDLPWRVDRNGSAGLLPDPYHVLVSELMLQQTQVTTVIDYFHRFITRLPTISALAAADEQDVLRLWQGLGYYSRARNLHAAARVVMEQHAGQLPADHATLMQLPGVGRYTAGALASLAFDQHAPILDGNVARVLCRLDAIVDDPRKPATLARLWQRAEEILPPPPGVGDFNSALMELGSQICIPRRPQCLLCPVRPHCAAFAGGLQERIPLPRKAKSTPLLTRWSFLIRRPGATPEGVHQWLIEQRPPRGRWAGLWQFITRPATASRPTAQTLRALLGLKTTPPRRLLQLRHALTHRRYHFDVFACDLLPAPDEQIAALDSPHRWCTLKELSAHPLPRPQVRMVELLEAERGD